MTTTVARAADPLFAAEAKFHPALEHPYDLLICVVAASDIDASTVLGCPRGLHCDQIIAEVDTVILTSAARHG